MVIPKSRFINFKGTRWRFFLRPFLSWHQCEGHHPCQKSFLLGTAVSLLASLKMSQPSATLMSLDSLALLLQQTLDPNFQKSAEQVLSQASSNPTIALQLLDLILAVSRIPTTVRMAAAIYVKNFVRSRWFTADGVDGIGAEIKDGVRKKLISALITTPESTCQQIISDAIASIATADFPFAWPDLLTSLLGNVASEDLSRTNAILGCFNLIFKRYQQVSRSDALFSELNYVLQAFASSYFGLFLHLDSHLQSSISAGARLPPKEHLNHLLIALFLMTKIFYSLNVQDLAEFFEDRLKEFSLLFHNYLALDSTALATVFNSGDLSDEGPIERLQTAVVQCVTLYASKYSEDFPQLDSFIPVIWKVLARIPSDQERFDHLAASCMQFLETIATQHARKQLFEAESTLNELAREIILPSSFLRPSDCFLWSDDSLDWVRRDVEGSVDSNVRRNRVSSLIRALLVFNEARLSSILMKIIQELLDRFDRRLSVVSGESDWWRNKDAALFLFTSAAVGGGIVTVHGASGGLCSSVRDSVAPFYQRFIHGDFLLKESSDLSNATGPHPLVLVAGMRFVCAFRWQIPPDNLLSIFPFLLHLVERGSSRLEGVAAMAQITLDRLLSTREPACAGGKPLLPVTVLRPLLEQSINVVLAILETRLEKSPKKLCLNEYLMRLLLRLIIVAKSEISAHFPRILHLFFSVIAFIFTKPFNPRFDHFLFEALAYLLRSCCGVNAADPTALPLAENTLVPLIQKILQSENQDFASYSFQTLSLLISLKSGPLSGLFTPLFFPLMHAELWQVPGNTQSLVRLVCAFIQRDQGLVAKFIPQMIAICTMLLQSRASELHGACILVCLVECFPWDQIGSSALTAITTLLSKAYSQPTAKVHFSVLLFFTHVALHSASTPDGNGAPQLVALLNANCRSPDFMCGLLSSLLVAEALKCRDGLEKRVVSLALLRYSLLVATAPEHSSHLSKVIACVAQLLTHPLSASGRASSESFEGGCSPRPIGRPADEEPAATEEGAATANASKLSCVSSVTVPGCPSYSQLSTARTAAELEQELVSSCLRLLPFINAALSNTSTMDEKSAMQIRSFLSTLKPQ